MFEAQYLIGDRSVYSPWMSRGGDKLIITVDVMQLSSGTLTVEPLTKNSEDTDDGAAVTGTALSITAASTTATSSSTFSGLEELIRYKFSWNATASSDYVLFRMLSPVWFDTVNAGT